MKQTLQLKLSQHLTLTPQLQQSIRLLQLSTVELNAEVERMLQENPLLEKAESDDDHRRGVEKGHVRSQVAVRVGQQYRPQRRGEHRQHLSDPLKGREQVISDEQERVTFGRGCLAEVQIFRIVASPTFSDHFLLPALPSRLPAISFSRISQPAPRTRRWPG